MRRIRDQHQMREILFQRGPNETGEVEVAEQIAVDDEERLIAEQWKSLCNSARGFERLGFARVADRDAGAASIAERRSEERRVGKEGRSRWWPWHSNKNTER